MKGVNDVGGAKLEDWEKTLGVNSVQDNRSVVTIQTVSNSDWSESWLSTVLRWIGSEFFILNHSNSIHHNSWPELTRTMITVITYTNRDNRYVKNGL
jgi:hypothetical protein